MVLRIASSALVMLCVLFTLNVGVVQAAYPGPAPACPPPAVVPVGPGFVTTGPAMAMPRPMSCAPACPPPCAPAMCEPPCQSGFSPLSAVWGMVSLPFKFIGGLFGSKQACNEMPMCPPQCCMPMLPPTCGPVCAPITKVKPQRRMPSRAASHHAPMPMSVPAMQ
jgi:hypothetical protein